MNSFAIALEVLLTPIIASGNNANVLHYIENNQQCKAGDLILLDVAAEYANYSSDMSRTIPVSGRYTKRQEVYNAVLNVKTSYKMLTGHSGNNTISKWKLMTSELLGLGLIDKDVQNENPIGLLIKKYFMRDIASHGIGHARLRHPN
jgi:Xaa-Pro aminopeptidase